MSNSVSKNNRVACEHLRYNMRLSGAMLAAIGVFLSSSIATTAFAQTVKDFERCRSIVAPNSRLRCYDDLVLSSQYKKMTLIQFKADRQQLVGQKVEVDGTLRMRLEDEVSLQSGSFDTTPVYIDISHVSREDKKFAYGCHIGCPAIVRGTVILKRDIEADQIIKPTGQ